MPALHPARTGISIYLFDHRSYTDPFWNAGVDGPVCLRGRRSCAEVGYHSLCTLDPHMLKVGRPHRDDPNVDENTRLRNRIAELESLVRELRGE